MIDSLVVSCRGRISEGGNPPVMAIAVFYTPVKVENLLEIDMSKKPEE